MNNRNQSLLLLIAVVFTCYSCEQKPPREDNSLATDNLSGKVKRVMEVTYTASIQGDNWVKGQQTQVFKIKSYTEEGFLIYERDYYSDSNQAAGGLNYVYDENYNLLRIESLDQDGGIVGYSNIGKREGKVRYSQYNDYFGIGEQALLTGKTDMTWDGYSLMKAITYDPEGNVVSTSEYTYDDNGDLTSFDIKTTQPEERYIKMLSSYEIYDDQGNWTRMFKQFESLPIKEIVEREFEYYE